jgi:hypothetical protein
MTVFVDRLDDALRAELSPMGFDRVRPRRWVSGSKGLIRRLFEFEALKGARYSARWGFSLDFVPDLRTGHLRWKRTSKSAKFDLCINPIDPFAAPLDWCSLLHLPGYDEVSIKDINRVVADTTRAARVDFARVDSVGDLVAIFQERAQMTFRRFSLENYVQTHIAWGLGLVAIGKGEEGEAHIRLFCERNVIDRNDPLIRKAEAEAIRYGATPSG